MKSRIRNPNSGFSLIEVVVLLVVVRLALPPIAILMYQTISDSAQSHMQAKALELAKGLMEEILSKEFEDQQEASGSFGTEEATRAAYDDVDDYDGLSEKPPRDSQGNIIDACSGFRAKIAVENVQPSSPGGSAAPDGTTQFKRVTTTIEWDGGEHSLKLVGLVTNHTGYTDGLTLLEGGVEGKNRENLRFHVHNDAGKEIYLTHLKATWAAPEAYYEKIKVEPEGAKGYDIWKKDDKSGIPRMGSGNVAMFVKRCVQVPASADIWIKIEKFKDLAEGKGKNVDMSGTDFTIELWGTPYKYQPFVVPP